MAEFVIVHGNVFTEDVVMEIRRLLKGDFVREAVYCEGGYLLTFATNDASLSNLGVELVNRVYEMNMDGDIDGCPPGWDISMPVFVGEYPTPIEVKIHDVTAHFVGGVWGTEEDGSRYQE